jgi:hypothetical protein
MTKIYPILITALIALAAVAIVNRIGFLNKIMYGSPA